MPSLTLSDSIPSDVNLFAGAGGLAIGLFNAGFGPFSFYEKDADACATLGHNIASDRPTLSGSVVQGDLTTVNWLDLPSQVRLLAAGVPCQPFSNAGNHSGEKDPRNMFPQFMDAARHLMPMAVIVENVRGLSKSIHSAYFDYLRLQLEYPFLVPNSDEHWSNHYTRLKRFRESPTYIPAYSVGWRLVDAANHGVAQRRQRVFFVAIRVDLGEYKFPVNTHSKASLLRDKASGIYWERHEINPRFENEMPTKGDYVAPWVTVRDQLYGLGEPADLESESQNNHWRIKGARTYRGHTGSDLDSPSKTIKAGSHGVPGGENTVIADSGTVRYYTLREMARIQGFPDEHIFKGTRSSVIRQIGNAVPPDLANSISTPLARLLGAKQ